MYLSVSWRKFCDQGGAQVEQVRPGGEIVPVLEQTLMLDTIIMSHFYKMPSTFLK